MKLTHSEIQARKLFLRTHKEQEKLYYPKFRAILNRQFRRAAKQYEETSVFNPGIIRTEDLEPTYRRLYIVNTIREARREWANNVQPHLKQLMRRKDLIDDLAELLNFNGDGNIIQIWRELLEDFVNVRILTRIQQVNETTRQKIADAIQDGINEGLGSRDIARKIREAASVNRARAMNIARTEVTTAMAQGKMLAIRSSNLVYDKGWSAHADNKTRDSHLAMLDASMIGLNDLFIVGGFQMAYPGDSSHGAPAKEIVNCRCSLVFRVRRDANGFPIRKVNQLQEI